MSALAIPLLHGLVRETDQGLDGAAATADFDHLRQYRYTLTRTWADGLLAVLWIMLNPSTADAFRLDPTVQRCLSRSKSLPGCGSMTIANLYAWRSPFPKMLQEAPDPVGPANDEVLRMLLPLHQAVVVAWGGYQPAEERAREVVSLIRDSGHVPLCLGTTAGGQPRHPGRLAYSVGLREYELEAAA